MRRIWFLSLLLTVAALARYTAAPLKECEAFNNMKHTKNTHHVVLDTARKYTILKQHKGQKLIHIKGEQPAQRWVDDTCFPSLNRSDVSPVQSKVIPVGNGFEHSFKKTSIPKHTKKYDKQKHSNKNLLALSWHNAFCETHRHKKECKRGLLSIMKPKYHERHFVLHGLWPQPKNKTYCKVDRKYITMDRYKHWNKIPDIGLSSETKKKLAEVMPGFASNLHKHEWIKHGTCYGTGAEQYYKDAISLTEQVNDSKVSDFFIKNIGKRVTLKQIRQQFDKSFGTGAGRSVELKCKNGLITELWLHLGGVSHNMAALLENGKQARSRCQRGLIDKAGFGR